jgi:hypothetical protein
VKVSWNNCSIWSPTPTSNLICWLQEYMIHDHRHDNLRSHTAIKVEFLNPTKRVYGVNDTYFRPLEGHSSNLCSWTVHTRRLGAMFVSPFRQIQGQNHKLKQHSFLLRTERRDIWEAATEKELSTVVGRGSPWVLRRSGMKILSIICLSCCYGALTTGSHLFVGIQRVSIRCVPFTSTV